MRIAKLLYLVPALTSCAGMQLDHDNLCHELARFANAEATTPRAVRLTNDWSIHPDPDNPGQNLGPTKACRHGDTQAEEDLCGYLLKNTSTEFPVLDYKRALRCLGMHVQINVDDKPQLPQRVKSRRVLGARVNSNLTVVFSPGNEEELPALEISAGDAR